jgi:hypothetical protein
LMLSLIAMVIITTPLQLRVNKVTTRTRVFTLFGCPTLPADPSTSSLTHVHSLGKCQALAKRTHTPLPRLRRVSNFVLFLSPPSSVFIASVSPVSPGRDAPTMLRRASGSRLHWSSHVFIPSGRTRNSFACPPTAAVTAAS